MGYEQNFMNRMHSEAEKKQEDFNKLTDKEKKDAIDTAHDKALRFKNRIDEYTSVDKIIPGIKDENIFRSSDYYKNKQVDNLGQWPEYNEYEGKDYDTQYNDAYGFLKNDLEENDGKKLEKIKKMFKDIPLIDLGAGMSQKGYFLAKLLGASGYVGVEPNNKLTLEKELTEGEGGDINEFEGKNGKTFQQKFSRYTGNFDPMIEKISNIPFAIAGEDALAFLKRLPDHSVGLCSFGVDGYVMSRKEGTTEAYDKIEKYIKDVNKEIKRVLHPNSAIIYNDSLFNGGDGLASESVEANGKYQFTISKPQEV